MRGKLAHSCLLKVSFTLRGWPVRNRRCGGRHYPTARLATPGRESLIFKPDKLSGHETVSHAPWGLASFSALGMRFPWKAFTRKSRRFMSSVRRRRIMYCSTADSIKGVSCADPQWLWLSVHCQKLRNLAFSACDLQLQSLR